MTHALIIGGGVAGPAAALALAHVGIRSTVFESHDAPADDVGASLGLAVNGMAALAELDAHHLVRSAGIPTPRGTLWLGNGTHLGTETTGTPLADGTVGVTTTRAALYAALRTTARDRGIDVRYGKRLVGVEDHPDHVVARFADGSDATADVLIGADGMRSTTRAHVDPHAPRPRFCHLIGTGGTAPDTGLGSEPGEFHMIFGRKAFVGHITDPVDRSVLWFINLPRRHEPAPAELAATGDREWRDRLLAAVADDDSPAAALIEATPARYDWSVMHQMDAPAHWHRGRTVLIGDAAHVTSPSSGQGASMAIEDALELARCLRDRADPTTAFATYQRLRGQRVAKVAAGARQVNRSKAATGAARVVRDALFPVLMKRFSGPTALDWLHDHRIPLDQPVPEGLPA